MRPTAIVMNMFYTGLGIARSLGAQGIPIVGLSAVRPRTSFAGILPPDFRAGETSFGRLNCCQQGCAL